jgi:hypothetical protein
MGEERLSRAEAEAIFRRAAEIEATQGMDDDLDMAALEEIAGEAGLSRQAVRQAALEIRTGGATPSQAGLLGPRAVSVTRTVDASVDSVCLGIDTWMERQQMRVRRRLADRTVWEPATGLTAGIVRAVDLNKQLRLKKVDLVVVDVVDVGGGRTHVRIELDFGKLRGGWLGGIGAAGGAGVVALGVGAAAVASGGGVVLAEVAALLTGATGVGAGTYGLVLGGRADMRKRQAAELDGIENLLDELESPSPATRPRLRKGRR